jgi:hypothetical protein
MSELPEQPQEGELILYQTPGGTVRIEVLYESETFWLSQKRIADLFGVDLRTVSYHLGEIFRSGELMPEPTLRKIRRVQTEGNRQVRREIEHYNLDAIISVGYRVNSHQATQFRIWATQTLREFTVKGFVLDDERLKLQFRKQAYQLAAVEAVVDCFAGQPKSAGIEYRIDPRRSQQGQTPQLGMETSGFRNLEIAVPPQRILENVHAVQRRQNLIQSTTLVVSVRRPGRVMTPKSRSGHGVGGLPIADPTKVKVEQRGVTCSSV